MRHLALTVSITLVALGLTLTLVAPVAAPSGTCDLHWLVLCGLEKFNPDQNVASVQRGQMQVTLTQRTDATLGTPDARTRRGKPGARLDTPAVNGGLEGPPYAAARRRTAPT